MRKGWLSVVGLTLLLISGIIGLAGCTTVNTTPNQGGGQQQGIWVNGVGKVAVVPDIANLRLGIEAQETTVAQAQARASGAMDKVMTALTDKGVAKKDIQTQQFSIQKVTRWDQGKQQEVLIGYRVANIVAAKIREIDKTGAIIDAAAEAGGDLTRIDSINFSVDNPATYYGQAREKAMTDARDKAKQLAELGGVTLGKPTYISESGQLPMPVPLGSIRTPAPAMAETPISPGEMEISLSIQVVYGIK